MYGLEGPDTGGEMKKRLLLVLLALATVLVAQEGQTTTEGEVNGLGWSRINEVGKVYFLMGVTVGGSVLANWYLADSPVCLDHVAKSKPYPPTINGAVIVEINKFYETAANMPLPVSVAVVYTYLKADGATKERLAKYRALMLKAYAK
jgi:hypothetical protein